MHIVRIANGVLETEAAVTFPETVIKEDIAAYIKNLTQVVAWDENFLSDVYDLYLRKITKAGNQLCENLNGKAN